MANNNYYDDSTQPGWSLNGTGWNTMSAKILASATLTGTETLTNKTITTPTIAALTNTGLALTSPTINSMTANTTDISNIRNATYATVTNLGNSSTAATVNWTTGGSIQKITLTGNCTFGVVAPPAPSRVSLMLLQDTTGSRTATWWAGIKWAGAAAPTLTTTASRTDIVTFIYDGSSYYGVASANFN
jgi:hypothetical protein